GFYANPNPSIAADVKRKEAADVKRKEAAGKKGLSFRSQIVGDGR
ncbi:hypothetical protein Tco_1518886, partial [Tanacetum coccineum]